MQATVTEIGKHAIDDSENDYSFWRNCYRYLEATCSYSIIPRKDQVTLAEGDHLKIGDTNYTITKWVLCQ